MTSGSESVKDKRVTFVASDNVINWVVTLRPGEKSKHINNRLETLKQTDSELRAARLKIADIEKQLKALEKFCPLCRDVGVYRGRTLVYARGGYKESSVPVFCSCPKGDIAIKTHRQEKEAVHFVAGVVECPDATKQQLLFGVIASLIGSHRLQLVFCVDNEPIWRRERPHGAGADYEARARKGIAVRCHARRDVTNLVRWCGERRLKVQFVVGLDQEWPCWNLGEVDNGAAYNSLPTSEEPE